MPETRTRENSTVVGIGASAGGLAALKTFLDHVPADSGLTFVVVVHLSPDHESHLAELLQPHVRVPVRQVNVTTALEPDRVYVIPPNANISTIDTHLRLSKLEDRRQERAPIDHFLRTLARTHDGNAVAVILTGTGSDGTLGIKDVKANGGLVIVQDPNEAEYDSMPQSAIATGLADYVLPLVEIPGAILRYDRTQPRVTMPSDGDEVPQSEWALLQKVFAQLRARTDRDFSRYKRSTVLRRVAKRMQLNYLEDLPAYVERLRERPEEVRALADDLLITVTHFFRDPEVFQKLENEVIPSKLRKKGPQESFRAWSVGCATGEEAYSLAMLLAEEAGRHEMPPQIQVFASDLHTRSLEKAREGFYPGDIVADVSADRLRRFFQKENGGYRVNKELRDLVVFAPHNILSDPPFSRQDLISCRNLLIYLDRDVQRDVIELFHYALNPDGILMLGSAESIDATDLFRVEDKHLCFFRKRNVPAREPRLPVFSLSRATVRGELLNRMTPSGEPVAYGRLHQQMVEQYAPPSVLVSPDNQLIHLSEHAGRYLVHPGGEPTASVLKLVRPELRIELQASLQTARESRKAFDSSPIPVQFNGHARSVVLHVRPSLEPERDGLALVIFEEREPHEDADAVPADHPGMASAAGRIRDLESELSLTRQRLQTIIEEYETSQEEMKASSEEMQSTNEELRSTLEELETSKEELQSINEELQTVNQQNRHKVEELAQLSSDLQNLLSATDIATLFLDRELRILRFTPRLGDLFNVRITDRGRPISDQTHRLAYSGLREDAESVLSRLVPVEREVQDDAGRWYLARVLPYRSTEDRIEGIVITFLDIDTRKRAEEALRINEERLRRMVNVDVVGILIFDASGTLIDSNEAFQKMAGYSKAEIAARKLTWRDMTPPEYVEASEQQLRKVAETGRIGPYEKEYFRQDGSRAWMLFAGASLGDGTIVEYCIDISDRKRAEALVRETSTYAENIIETLHEPLLVLSPDLTVRLGNPAFYRFFKMDRSDTLGRRLYDLGNGQWDIPVLRRLLEEVLPRNGAIEDFELAHGFENIESRVILLNARRLAHQGLILLGMRDITERKRLEENLVDQVHQTTEALSSTQAELRALSGRLMAAQEDERRRIARELHDDLAQRAAVVDVTLQRVAQLLPSVEGAEAIAAVRGHLNSLSVGLREISHRLHPSVIVDLGLATALKELVRELNEAGGDISFQGSDVAPQLSPDEALALYRIAQEALNNARKHAPKSSVRVFFKANERYARLSIEDDGPGFKLPDIRNGRGLGLLSMQERARMMGGKLFVRTRLAGGTRISVHFRRPRHSDA
ncbi:MAG TPA: CheR family methyltransferase [Bryobacteraceae bacterium]|nr:CheR family methyltransferase [Bryobacteraceae bacterium]